MKERSGYFQYEKTRLRFRGAKQSNLQQKTCHEDVVILINSGHKIWVLLIDGLNAIYALSFGTVGVDAPITGQPFALNLQKSNVH